MLCILAHYAFVLQVVFFFFFSSPCGFTTTLSLVHMGQMSFSLCVNDLTKAVRLLLKVHNGKRSADWLLIALLVLRSVYKALALVFLMFLPFPFNPMCFSSFTGQSINYGLVLKSCFGIPFRDG